MQEQGWGTGTHRGYYAKNSVNSLDLLVFFSYQPVIPFNVPQKLFYLQKKKVSDRRTNISKHLNLLSERSEY